jgi:hypothetical protein
MADRSRKREECSVIPASEDSFSNSNIMYLCVRTAPLERIAVFRSVMVMSFRYASNVSTAPSLNHKELHTLLKYMRTLMNPVVFGLLVYRISTCSSLRLYGLSSRVYNLALRHDLPTASASLAVQLEIIETSPSYSFSARFRFAQKGGL